jgi:2-amino-4-hydroxy-6-hydroxymethyldihydropteridine diphosphokinase
MRAGIALGGNLGDRLACLTKARDEIFALPGVHPPFLWSPLYETEPVDCEARAPKFLNAVIEIGHDGASGELLGELQRIEVALGRPPEHERHRSRRIDVDLLYHGARVLDQPGIQLPHPRTSLRGFVLRPLSEIRPNLVLPEQTKTVRELAEELPPGPSVVRASLQW